MEYDVFGGALHLASAPCSKLTGPNHLDVRQPGPCGMFQSVLGTQSGSLCFGSCAARIHAGY